MEESRGRGHAHESCHLRSATRLAVNHHPVRIAPEVLDVLVNPAQRRCQVSHANVCGTFVSRPADLGHVKEPKNVKAVVDGDLDDIVMSGHLRALM